MKKIIKLIHYAEIFYNLICDHKSHLCMYRFCTEIPSILTFHCSLNQVPNIRNEICNTTFEFCSLFHVLQTEEKLQIENWSKEGCNKVLFIFPSILKPLYLTRHTCLGVSIKGKYVQ